MEIKTNKAQLFQDLRYTPHEGQHEVHYSDARFRTVAAGRRWGKSLMAGMEGLAELVKPDTRGWIVAPTYDLANKVFREIYWLVMRDLKDWVGRASDSRQYLQLVNGATVEAKSADNPDSLVGEGLDWIIVDEGGRIKEEVWTECLRPTLTDKRGWALFISTPRGAGWFKKAYAMGQDPLWDDFQSWQFPSETNPHLDPQEIELARRTLPERVFQQEFQAMFLDDAGGVFRGVRNCIRGALSKPIDGHSYAVGVDLAKYQDFTVFVAMDQTSGQVVHFDRFKDIDWPLQKQRIIAVGQRYPGKVIIDSTGVGDPIFDDLRRTGLNVEGYRFTNESKRQVIDNLSICIEKEEIGYPDIPELINELEIFEYEMTASGNLRFNAPGGYHDDCVIALALASWGYKKVFDYSRWEEQFRGEQPKRKIPLIRW